MASSKPLSPVRLQRTLPAVHPDDDTFSVSMRIYHENVSPFEIHAYDTVSTPAGFAEIVAVEATVKIEFPRALHWTTRSKSSQQQQCRQFFT
jgi:hypothetical protein